MNFVLAICVGITCMGWGLMAQAQQKYVLNSNGTVTSTGAQVTIAPHQASTAAGCPCGGSKCTCGVNPGIGCPLYNGAITAAPAQVFPTPSVPLRQVVASAVTPTPRGYFKTIGSNCSNGTCTPIQVWVPSP